MIKRLNVWLIYRDLLHLLEDPERLVTSVKDRPGHDRHQASASDKLEHQQTWGPSTQFLQGLADTVAGIPGTASRP